MVRCRHPRQVDYVPFDRVASTFDRTRYIPISVLRRAYRLVLTNVVWKGDITVLDAGVGTGRIIRPLLNRRLTLIGVDISLPMLLQTRMKYGRQRRRLQLHVVVADVAHLPIRNSSMDVVQSTHVLHLLKHWKIALREWQRVLRPTGALVILQESGQRTRVRIAYDQVLKQMTNYRRRMVYSKVIQFLRQKGWRVRQNKIRWVDKPILTSTLRAIENRSYSRQWSVPDEVHEKGLARARRLVDELHEHGVKSEKLNQELLILTAKQPR